MIAEPSSILTPADVLAMPDDGQIYELVNGELRVLDMSKKSSHIAVRILTRLENHIEAHNAGYLFGIDAGFTCFENDPRRLRKPDGAFIATERMNEEEYAADGYSTVVPDFVFEVLSPNDLAYDVTEKRLEWLAAGVQLLWIVDPVEEVVLSYRPSGLEKEYKRQHIITAEPILPGFQCHVAEFFKCPKHSSGS